jgi:hypothetical protein
MMRTTIVLVVAVVAALAHGAYAEPATPNVDLGTPLPAPSAIPALSGISALAGFDITDVAAMPSMKLDSLYATPRRDAVFAGITSSIVIGGNSRPGWFRFYRLGVTYTLPVGGSASASFTSNGTTLTGGNVHYYGIALPVPGYGYRRGIWIATAQLVPQIDLFSAEFQAGKMTVSGSDTTLSISAELQVCRQFNLLGFSSKNSATCAYVAPALYRDGWMNGIAFGVRTSIM